MAVASRIILGNITGLSPYLQPNDIREDLRAHYAHLLPLGNEKGEVLHYIGTSSSEFQVIFQLDVSLGYKPEIAYARLQSLTRPRPEMGESQPPLVIFIVGQQISTNVRVLQVTDVGRALSKGPANQAGHRDYSAFDMGLLSITCVLHLKEEIPWIARTAAQERGRKAVLAGGFSNLCDLGYAHAGVEVLDKIPAINLAGLYWGSAKDGNKLGWILNEFSPVVLPEAAESSAPTNKPGDIPWA